mgnify:CR=1 FL=1
MTLTIVPEEFTLVLYDAAAVRAVFEEVAGLVGFPAEVPISLEVDEELGQPLTASYVDAHDGRALLWYSGGNFEDTHRPRHLDEARARRELAVGLLRGIDRLDGRFAAAPVDDQLTDAQRAAMAQNAAVADEATLIDRCAQQLAATMRPSMRPVFNLTGTVLHTNLGRALVGTIAADAARLLPEHLQDAYLTPEASENLVLDGVGVAGKPTPAGTDDATGSNNWAIDGGKGAGGFPMLAGDPHQPFWVPSSWYEFALHGPEDDAAGCGHPGVPGL